MILERLSLVDARSLPKREWLQRLFPDEYSELDLNLSENLSAIRWSYHFEVSMPEDIGLSGNLHVTYIGDVQPTVAVTGEINTATDQMTHEIYAQYGERGTLYRRRIRGNSGLKNDSFLVREKRIDGSLSSLLGLIEENPHLTIQFDSHLMDSAFIPTTLSLETPKEVRLNKGFEQNLKDLIHHYDTKGIPYVLKNGRPEVLK